MTVSFSRSELTIRGKVVITPWPILEAFDDGDRVIVLLDPDAYVSDPTYKTRRRAGMAAVRNLQAYSHEGAVLWEANFPDEVDYYGQIWSRFPLVADSFSSFRCEIDSTNGNIISRQFFK